MRTAAREFTIVGCHSADHRWNQFTLWEGQRTIMTTAIEKPWNLTAQHARRLELAALTRWLLRPQLDDNAQSDKLVWWDQDRVALWATNAFFLGTTEDIAFGNTIIRYVRDILRPQPSTNLFVPAALAGLLKHHEHHLDADVHEFALTTLDAFLPFGLTRDFQFHGYNDNMPLEYSWALTIGGEVLNNPRYTDVAWANLCQAKDLLRRRGTNSEYGAGYCTTQVPPLAAIAESSQNATFRELALALETRWWAALAGMWHPAFAQVCGASMRGGPAWYHEASALLRQIFGDAINISVRPWKMQYEQTPHDFVVELGLDPAIYTFAYLYGFGNEFASKNYHVPDEIAELFYHKAKGFTAKYTAENGFINGGLYRKMTPVTGTGGITLHNEFTEEILEVPHFPVHAAQPHGLITYHGTNYAIGTSTTNQFGSSHAFRCTYRRSEQPSSAADYGHVMLRYNINDKQPCGRLKNAYWKDHNYQEVMENYNQLYYDQGRHHCLQEGNTVLCLQVPLWAEYWQITSLHTDLFFHTDFGPVGQLFYGDRAIDTFPFTSEQEALITINEGATYIAVLPMIGRHRERQAAVKIWQSESFLVVSLYNYEGAPIELSAREMAKQGNGFVFEVRDAADYASFADFQQEMRQARCHDQLYGGTRRIHYARPDLRLSMVMCPYTNTVMYRAVNGLNHDFPQFSYSTGTPKLPLLEGTLAVGFEDWEWITTQIEREVETYNPQD